MIRILSLFLFVILLATASADVSPRSHAQAQLTSDSASDSSPDTTNSAPEVTSSAPKASFFLVGGAADAVLSDFVRLAGGEKANIAIITHASEDPASAGDELQNALTALNVKNTTVILPGNTTGLPSGTNAVFICGGDQNRLKRLLTDPLLKQLSQFDGLIGGSSAGAMIAAPRMIAGGMDENTVRAQRLKVVDGLVFLPKVVVDTHVGQRSRDTRCAAALALIPEVKLAIGLDEDTAVHVDKSGKCTVYGAGHARLFTRGPKFSSTISKVLKGEIANVRDLRLSLLCSGDEFELVDFTN